MNKLEQNCIQFIKSANPENIYIGVMEMFLVVQLQDDGSCMAYDYCNPSFVVEGVEMDWVFEMYRENLMKSIKQF